MVLLLGLVRLFDSFLGINTAILYNSRYYVTLLVMGVFLALLTIVLNAILIPIMGLEGAALATFCSVLLYNASKLVFVKWKFGLTPWSINSLKVVLLGLGTYLLLFWVVLPFHPLINIVVKSIGIGLIYLGGVIWFRISEDLVELIYRRFEK